MSFDSLFKITTDAIVIQKKGPGHPTESIIANATVKMNMRTSTMMLQTIRGVRLPLHISNKSKEIYS